MKPTRVLTLFSLIPLALAGCTLGVSVETSPTPTLTVTASATPDIYATSAQRTLIALEAQRTAAGLIGTRAPDPSATHTRPGDSDTPTPVPTVTPSPTLTPTLTLTPTPLEPATVIPTQQNKVLIRAFSATPNRISPGGTFILSWAAQGEKATLHQIDELGMLISAEEIPLSGSRTVTTEDTLTSGITYALYVSSGELVESAVATVGVRCTGAWFFVPGPGGGCPSEQIVQTAAAAQRFERGLMVWLADLQRIYVLFNDNDLPAYESFGDPWAPGLPENDPALNPPEGYQQPVRGFGMVWRGEGPGADPEVRSRIGWALQPEFGYDAALQCDSATTALTCYLRGPDGEIIRLDPEGVNWQVQVPAP